MGIEQRKPDKTTYKALGKELPKMRLPGGPGGKGGRKRDHFRCMIAIIPRQKARAATTCACEPSSIGSRFTMVETIFHFPAFMYLGEREVPSNESFVTLRRG